MSLSKLHGYIDRHQADEISPRCAAIIEHTARKILALTDEDLQIGGKNRAFLFQLIGISRMARETSVNLKEVLTSLKTLYNYLELFTDDHQRQIKEILKDAIAAVRDPEIPVPELPTELPNELDELAEYIQTASQGSCVLTCEPGKGFIVYIDEQCTPDKLVGVVMACYRKFGEDHAPEFQYVGEPVESVS